MDFSTIMFIVTLVLIGFISFMWVCDRIWPDEQDGERGNANERTESFDPDDEDVN